MILRSLERDSKPELFLVGNYARQAPAPKLPESTVAGSRHRNVEFLTTLEADLVGATLDRKNPAHLIVTAPKGQSQYPH
jgi:hypothetical protein